MEYDIIIHGKVTTKEKDKFQNSFNKLLDETNLLLKEVLSCMNLQNMKK